jgi:TetR/AcrR family transcriptional regulator
MDKPKEQGESTELLILSAARKVFVKKGLEGARMQEIADEAGINKALLHYYFRSKDKLFKNVLNQVLSEFIPLLGQTISSDESLEQKLKGIVEIYLGMLEENSFVPQFIIGEINRDPDGLRSFVDELAGRVIEPNLSKLVLQIDQEHKKGTIRKIDPRDLIINILSLCIFPILAKPIVMQLMFKGDPEAYSLFIKNRRKHIPDFVLNSLRP